MLNTLFTRIPSQSILTFESVGAYTGVQLSNHTGRTIYVMGVDGIVHDLASRPSYGYLKDASPKICVRIDARYHSEASRDGRVHPMNEAAGRFDDAYITSMDELYTASGLPTAVYLPQANVTVSLVPDTNLLRQAHPYLRSPVNADTYEFSRLMVNLHDTSKKYLYVASAHGVSKITVTHDLAKPEFIRLRVRDEYGSPKQYRLDIDDTTDLRCIDIGYTRFGLVMGISPEMVRDRFDELHNGPAKELEELKKILENTRKELEITKNENAILKKKVDSVVNKVEEVNELNRLKLKADIADAEYAKTKASIEADMENLPIQMQHENQKSEMDLAVAQAKLSTAESDNKAQAWKSTAVVAGAAATMGVVATKVLSTSATVSATGAVGIAGTAAALAAAPVTIAVGCGLATAALFRKDVRESISAVTNSTLKGLSSLCRSCVDCTTTSVKNAVQTVSDCGKTLFRKGASLARSAVTTAVDTVKSIGRAASDAVSSICDTVTGWLF